MKEVSQREKMNSLLQLVAPGTPFRDGLENVLRAKTGALLVVGYSPEVMEVVDGGFAINCDFSPNYLYELAKMDGAIILSEDLKRILYANTQLIPNSSIPSTETGIRHRTAERVAKQTGKLVVSISQRRNIITLYQGTLRYSLKDMGFILTKANQAIRTLERYQSVLSQAFTNLSAMEYEDLVTLQEVAHVIQRSELLDRIKTEIIRYVNELGTEGRLIRMQMEELIVGLEEEVSYLITDYIKDTSAGKVVEFQQSLKRLSNEELLEASMIVKLLGYPNSTMLADEAISSRGYRLLSKIPRLPVSIMNKLVEKFGKLSVILMATAEDLDAVEGIGEVRARTIRDGLRRIQEQVFIDRQI
ncbi:MAG: DNA integrity scanning diadenylate cyclase DisA [Candidatus Pristimantibacillus lignocellulolyticus]|uniref:diadenylate cyclase n=1 Tax=Candidatus Pristimantibacillus lignocellulolyticus TaxID=2994561 RepID=A0A9J6ZIY5_9BACL|nr:MAG: DNA integrity scanning diadenylate cyclase DisA [Candidatus Pristimantibacillus lignocellulolyticus]